MEEQEKFSILGDIHIPSVAELADHFEKHFHVVNGQWVSKEPQPVIIDYISIL